LPHAQVPAAIARFTRHFDENQYKHIAEILAFESDERDDEAII
jgi:hypothetical protein